MSVDSNGAVVTPRTPLLTAAAPYSNVSRGEALTVPIELYSHDIAERAKLRARARANKNRVAPKSTTVSEPEVIEIPSSDTDELNLRPPMKKTKAKKSLSKSSPARRHENFAHIPAELSLDEMEPLPVATSDFSANHSSQLPPSDPPLPSTGAHPPATPPIFAAANNICFSPPLSPSPVPVRKRKKSRNVVLDEEKDELLLEPRSAVIAAPPPPSATTAMPAVDLQSKGSSCAGPSDDSRSDKSNVRSRGKKRAHDDDTDDHDRSDALSSKVKAKAKARRRVADTDEEWDGDNVQIVASMPGKKRHEEDEDEWNGDSPVKPKPKKREKKAKQQKQGGVASDTSNSSSVSKCKRKAAAKEKPPPMSAECVEDSDGERDANLMPPPEVVPVRPIASTSTHHHLPPDNLSVPLASIKEPDSFGSAGWDANSDDTRTNSKGGNSDENGRQSSSAAKKDKGKKRALVLSEDEEDVNSLEVAGSPPKKVRREPAKGRKSAPGALERLYDGHEKENVPGSSVHVPIDPSTGNSAQAASHFKPPAATLPSKLSTSNRSYSVSSRRSLPMSELLRKVNSQPGSPFASTRPTYSPLLKTSRSFLSRIAPLHPNRRTPPPPLPRPPPPKKTKKQIELEEKWEMELEDTIEGWYCLPEEERAALRRAKRNAELGFED
ncbi:uncharacterized protein LAESUDRAFT_730100 [Laetiporus sulphureus 93-53]|uniref:Uncharacterized protein n=1 Tax=Laetiporus sulphureus 93-53 TaxID=1314785 RepID=A0A165CD07_9APHY|nr:uncharacterized protein LAESUDRAFT_730100 [Laetiporus sulphureus 93-53]KZT02589.1 hypothetical protein LAESUDRAFT_730100 [Laetiporus sulphureus 93-53]